MRFCPASAHHPSACRSLRPAPTPPPRGPGWAAAGFRANLFKREAAAGLERQGSAFLRQSTGRHACCNPIHGGSSTDTASDNPPARPGLICTPATQLKRGAAIPPGTLPRGRGREAGLRGLSFAGNGTSGLSRASTVKHQYSAHLSDPGQQERLESP